jgi:hypothetical protein
LSSRFFESQAKVTAADPKDNADSMRQTSRFRVCVIPVEFAKCLQTSEMRRSQPECDDDGAAACNAGLALHPLGRYAFDL